MNITASYEADVNETSLDAHGSSSSCRTDVDLQLMRVICDVFLSFPLATLGIVANIVSFIVLKTLVRKQSTTVYLLALSVADILVLICALLLQCFRTLAEHFDVWQSYTSNYHVIFVVVYPCVFVVRLAGVWMMVSLTIDRYIAVCYPLAAQRLCTLSRAYKQVCGFM